jgi:hypothetical protein
MSKQIYKKIETTVTVRGKQLPCFVSIYTDYEDMRLEEAFECETEESISDMYKKLDKCQAEWLIIFVDAKLECFEGNDCLGGNWIDSNYTLDQALDEHGMIDNAIRELSKEIESQYIKLSKIFEVQS